MSKYIDFDHQSEAISLMRQVFGTLMHKSISSLMHKSTGFIQDVPYIRNVAQTTRLQDHGDGITIINNCIFLEIRTTP